MTFEAFKDAVLRLALEMGADAAEIYYQGSESSQIGVYQQAVDSYVMSQSAGVNLRVSVGGKSGSAYTEILEDPEPLVEAAIDNARVITSSEVQPMQKACAYPQFTAPTDPLQNVSEAERIERLKEMERHILAQDPRVVKMPNGAISTDTTVTKIYNTLGLAAEDTQHSSACIASCVVSENDELQNSFAFKGGEEADQLLPCGEKAVSEALAKLGAAPVESGVYNAVFRHDAFASLLSAFFPMFNAENAQKDMSLLAGREGDPIASPAVTLVDDPLYPKSPRAFDAEGTPSVKTVMIEKGILKSLLHNLKTAAAAGVAPTSNAGRASAAAPITIAPSTMYIEPGEASYDELLAQMGDGLVITSVGGLHAGLNPISGSFSLLAGGLLVKDGKVVQSVNQITIAGSFESLFGGIAAVGSDLKFGHGGIGSPSVYVTDVRVAGK
ncbi:MAG: TldD/PmbA family protein [Lachnospiraceae bacterium]|jgi:PmbA protein|nr:TldD/PmbA family protein [Lachnospiraceae bacterium]